MELWPEVLYARAMLDLDQVASQFRATVRVRPNFARPGLERFLVVTDATEANTAGFVEVVKAFLGPVNSSQAVWATVSGDEARSVPALLARVSDERADLVVAPRHLFEDEVDLPHSLGTHADMLAQVSASPLLLLPHPRSPHFPGAMEPVERVLIVTDHIVGDDRLVSWGLRFVEGGGRLKLAHVEDDAVLARYLDVIGRIPGLDTDLAHREIEGKLLGEARAYIAAVAESVFKDYPKVEVRPIVTRGHTVQDHVRIVNEGEVDLVIMNTKDDTQQAMHGAAYSLAVELVHVPLLLL